MMVRNGKNMAIVGSIIVLLFCFQSSVIAGNKIRSVKNGDYVNYNILFVSFDALQYSHAGFTGYIKNTTPNIDNFAKKGFLFKNGVSQSSWTVPATMTWFTSLYPSEHGCINKYSVYTDNEKILTNLEELSPEVVTLAEILKKNGYVTGGFNGDAGVSGRFGFKKGFDDYIDGPKFGGMDNSIPKALEWVKKNKNKKFFIFLHGYDCHGQYDPLDGYTKRFLDFNYTGPFKGGKEEQGNLREEGLEKGFIKLTEEDVKFWRALYDEKISDVDRRFGEFIKEFSEIGLLKNTIVILVSDHGTEFYEHKRFDHGFSLYDELVHVPLIIWVPDLSEGMVIEDQVRGIDIMPTVLDLLGMPTTAGVKDQMKGVSLIPLMRGGHLNLTAFSETDYRLVTHKRSIRTNDGWKFIYTMENEGRELYNLKNDPEELNNLVNEEKATAYELEQELFKWLKSMGQDENYYKKIWAHMLKIKEY